LQYDVASLLYDGKADLPPELREKLLCFYLDELEKYTSVQRKDFLYRYDAFVLIRILQALGTYGFRGYYEKKAHFLLSIPYAIRNIKYLMEKREIPLPFPDLRNALLQIINSKNLPQYAEKKENILTVSINSFSYKKGIPQDLSANGGGFVFDCRALPNPGREVKFRELTGKDAAVIEYLEKEETVHQFIHHAFSIIDLSVSNYLSRNFSHLAVNFGCTGGQHRSVFFAEACAQHLNEKYPNIRVLLKHTNQELK